MDIQKRKKFKLLGLSRHVPEFEQYYKQETGDLTEFRATPRLLGGNQETSIFPMAVIIKIYIEPYTSIEIRNAAVVKDYQDMFMELWDGATRK